MLLLIDLQQRLMPSIAGGERWSRMCAGLPRRRAPRRAGGGKEQNPAGLGGTIPAFAALPARRLDKRFFDATREADFEKLLRAGCPAIVVAGCEADVCVMQTVLGLLYRGRAVSLVADAVGSRSPANRDAALARAARHGAELVTTEMVLFEWLATSDHPRFREVLGLVKT